MEEEKSGIQKLLDHLKEYLKTWMDLAILTASEKIATILSDLISGFLLLIIFLFFLLFGSFSIAYSISEYYEETYIGFLVVAVTYLLIGIILWIKKEKWIKLPLLNRLIKQFFQKKNDY